MCPLKSFQFKLYYNKKSLVYLIFAVTIEMDIKSMIIHLHLVLVTTLNKWANILVAAAENLISPYSLSAQEYSQLRHDIKRVHGIDLTSDMNKIQMSALVEKDTLNLIFHIPMYDEDQLYNFYRIDPIHIF